MGEALGEGIVFIIVMLVSMWLARDTRYHGGWREVRGRQDFNDNGEDGGE